MEKMSGTTLDIVAQNVAKLKKLFPEAFTEGKVDFEVLKEVLGTFVDGRDERYSFTWNGKSKARMIAQTPTTGTLRPCKEESVDWDTTQNIFIEGDNLEVLKLLQKSYHKQVKMIYIDPPYNTGNDFVYKDNFKDNIKNYKEITGQVDGAGRNLSNNPETSGRYHTDWLNMMYPRLKLARNLLKDDGVIFISIDDNEVANLRKICDEIFGEENFVVEFIWKSKSGGANDSKHIAKDNEYVICFAKSIDKLLFHLDKGATVTTFYNREDEKGKYSLDRLDKQSLGYQKTLDFPIIGPDKTEYKVVHKNPKIKVARWRWGKETVKQRYDDLVFENGYVYTKNYEKEGSIVRNLLLEDRFGRTRTGKTDFTSLFDTTYFNSPKPIRLIKYFLEVISDQDDIILDFFSGSATTAHAVMKLNAEDNGNRKFIMVQLPEACDEKSEAFKAGYKTIAEISKERIRRAAAKIKEENPEYDGDLGFKVFKLDSTNIKPWEANFDMDEKFLNSMIGNIKPNRSEEDILYEILLKYGLDLTLPITEHTIAGQKVFDIGMGALIICLSDAISLAVVEGIAGLKDKLKPEIMRVVFKDAGFKDDVVKTNAVQILKLSGIVDVRSL